MDNGKMRDKLKHNFHTWNSSSASEGVNGGAVAVKATTRGSKRVTININIRGVRVASPGETLRSNPLTCCNKTINICTELMRFMSKEPIYNALPYCRFLSNDAVYQDVRNDSQPHRNLCPFNCRANEFFGKNRPVLR